MAISKGIFNFKDVTKLVDDNGTEVTQLKDSNSRIMYGKYALNFNITNSTYLKSYSVTDDGGKTLSSGSAMYYGHGLEYAFTPKDEETVGSRDASGIASPTGEGVVTSTDVPKLRLTNPNGYSVTAYYKTSSSATTETSLGTISSNSTLDITPTSGVYYLKATSSGYHYAYKVRVYQDLQYVGSDTSYADFTTSGYMLYSVPGENAAIEIGGLRSSTRLSQVCTSPEALMTRPTYNIVLQPYTGTVWDSDKISLDNSTWNSSVSKTAEFGSTVTYYLKPAHQTTAGPNVYNIYNNPSSYGNTSSSTMTVFIPGYLRSRTGSIAAISSTTDYITAAGTIYVPHDEFEEDDGTYTTADSFGQIGRLGNCTAYSYMGNDEDEGISGYGVNASCSIQNGIPADIESDHSFWVALIVKTSAGTYYKGTETVTVSARSSKRVNFYHDIDQFEPTEAIFVAVPCEQNSTHRDGSYGAKEYLTIS